MLGFLFIATQGFFLEGDLFRQGLKNINLDDAKPVHQLLGLHYRERYDLTQSILHYYTETRCLTA